MIAKNREEGKQLVSKRTAAFSDGYGTFTDPAYDEAKLREGFVNPFWGALGWDVEGSAREIGPAIEVVFED